jgi:serine/threonine protein kinase
LALAPGARLGPYEIVGALGAGGMGEVYKARDTRLDRTVAVKMLPAALATDPQFRTRFDREARSISQLTHRHICRLYDVGEHEGAAFLVMELLEGETLAARLEKGALKLDDALRIGIEIAEALEAAHRFEIVHRDVKPGNIILTRTGAKLLDFGLAKPRAPAVADANGSRLPTTPPSLTVQGTILGTTHYMAPEQIEGQEADARTDLFAFGCVLYEMHGLRGTDARERDCRDHAC